MMLSPVELEYMRRHRGLLNPNCMLDALFPHIDALQARVVELEQDAARYRWTDPNDKTQKQYLPWIGEAVLFCHGGVTYYGQHTGGSFQTGHGVTARNFNTWECRWMYPPAAPKPEGV